MTMYQPLGPVKTLPQVSLDKNLENVRINTKQPVQWLYDRPDWKKLKDVPCALLGGGPSIKQEISNIANFEGTTFICGSSHDYIMENWLVPDFCVVCDPDPIMADYITKPSHAVTYLIATQCDPCLFERLKGYKVYKWHCYNNEFDKMKEIDPEFQAVGGGCTVGLRTLSLAMMFGYRDIHFWGFDSCLGTNKEHHAYDFVAGEETGDIIEVKLDPHSDKTYYCIGYQMAQAQHFKDFYEFYNDCFTPTFHGTGLLPDLMIDINRRVKELQNESGN